jgi:hypothetical protein
VLCCISCLYTVMRRSVTLHGVWIGDWIYWPLLTQASWLHLTIAPSLIFIFSNHYSMHSVFSVCYAFSSHSLVKAFNSGASMLTSLPAGYQLHWLSLLFTDSLSTLSTLAPTFLLITPRHGPYRKHRSLLYSNCFHGNLFVREGFTQ